MSHDPLLGALLSDRFRIVRKLPIESLNELYEGEDVSQRRRVLVKFIYRGYLNTQRAEARFREEIMVVRELESQHVTRVFDLGVTEESGPFLVTEYLQGLDLKELIEREGRLAVGRAVTLAIHTLRGLDEAHARGLLHFNLKPENLFVCDPGTAGELAKILDFGIAKVRVSRFWRHLAPEMRSVVYMAPERLDEEASPDLRADLYSVGAILYECLAGKPPHAGGDEARLIEQILEEKPVRLELLRPGLPAGLSELVHRALSPNPGRRMATAEEFIQALAPFARSTKGAEQPAGEAGKGGKAAKPKTWSLPSVLGGLAALGALSFYYLSKAPEPPVPNALPEMPSARLKPAAPSARVQSAASMLSALVSPAPPPAAAVPSSSVVAIPPANALPPPSASAALPPPSASAAPQSVLCYLNRVSGVVSTRGAGCRNPVFIKPNMTARDKFPKWIPPYCGELSVFHCETAPETAPAPEPEGG
jgi:eukaryotic-like serine/threonine-protein kinase